MKKIEVINCNLCPLKENGCDVYHVHFEYSHHPDCPLEDLPEQITDKQIISAEDMVSEVVKGWPAHMTLGQSGAVELMRAYHNQFTDSVVAKNATTEITDDQFTITPSERERQIATLFAEDVKFGYIKTVGGWLPCLEKHPIKTIEEVFDRFIQSDLFKSIPPAMPSREEAKKWAKERLALINSDQGHVTTEFVNGAMAMYDHLIERAKQ